MAARREALGVRSGCTLLWRLSQAYCLQGCGCGWGRRQSRGLWQAWWVLTAQGPEGGKQMQQAAGDRYCNQKAPSGFNSAVVCSGSWMLLERLGWHGWSCQCAHDGDETPPVRRNSSPTPAHTVGHKDSVQVQFVLLVTAGSYGWNLWRHVAIWTVCFCI